MNIGQLPKFEHTRARFVRADDLTECMGWVVGERNLKFLIQFDGEIDLAEGQELVGEIALLDWTLKLRGNVRQVVVKAGEVVATVAVIDASNLNALHGSGRERFRVQGMKAEIWEQDKRLTTDAAVLDISMEGIGLHTTTELRSGMVVRVVIEGGRHPFEFDCEVRYVRKESKGFRSGLLIQHNDRVGNRKWSQFLIDLNKRTSIAA